MKAIAGIAFVLVLVVGSVWMHFAAPCSVYKYHTVKDVPARCLMNK